jgi:tellurite resistance protein TerB
LDGLARLPEAEMAKLVKESGPKSSEELMKLRDRNLLEGAMATAALVALADERLVIEETLAVKLVLERARQLRLHDVEQAIDLYTGYIDRLRTDRTAGRQSALQAISRCGNDIEAAELVVNVGVAVAKADKDFSSDEVSAIEEICRCLGIAGLDALALGGISAAKVH